MSVSSHVSIADQISSAVVHSATSHTVGALMRGHSLLYTVLIAAVLIACVWLFKRVF